MREGGIDAQFILVCPPIPGEVERVVEFADVSLNTGEAGGRDPAGDPQSVGCGYFPCLLMPRRRAGKAQPPAVKVPFVHGTSMPKVDELLQPQAPITSSSEPDLRRPSERSPASGWFPRHWERR